MYVPHSLPQIIDMVLAHGAAPVVLTSLTALIHLIGLVAAGFVGSKTIGSSVSRLRFTANRIYSRMQSLRLNETQLSEQCSLVSIHLFEDADVPSLTRHRVSKILMNRHDEPAKSAARTIAQAELTVFAHVLKVSAEWLQGQADNRDPVVWNVLANPDRVINFVHLLQEYETLGNETKVWSQYPMYTYTSDSFFHALNCVQFGRKPCIPNTRPLVEFYNRVARLRRKWIMRPNRSFKYTNLIRQSHFERVTCGEGPFSAISRTILTRNLDVIIDGITNPSLKLKVVILKDVSPADCEAVRDYEIMGTVDNLLSIWHHHNGDIGWSEHPTYVNPHRQLLDRMEKHSLCRDVNETVDYIRSLQSRLRNGSK